MMNKIAGTVCSTKDGEHKTVFDLLDESLRTPYLTEKLHITGRLDLDTEGFLLLTTDGALTHRLISPKSHVGKTYYCELEKSESVEAQEKLVEKFNMGFEIPSEGNESGFVCKSSILEWIREDNCEKSNKAKLTIYEGKFHQVKRMFKANGNHVIYLKRLSIGNLILDESLKPGEYKKLTDEEVKLLVESR